MRVAARAATDQDLPALTALVAACASAVVSERGGRQYVGRELVRPPYDRRLVELISDPAALVLAGMIDDEVLGVGLARVERCAGDELLARLELLFVDPDAREVGLGEALVRATLAWAAGKGATGLDAYALPGGRAAKNFLESSGFRARLLVMHLDSPRR